MVDCPKELKIKFDDFIVTCEKNAKKIPYIVVVLMHDLFRNLFPADPYIPLDNTMHRLDAVSILLDTYKKILLDWDKLGSYNFETIGKAYSNSEDLKTETGKIYGYLWERYPEDMVREAMKIIKERFSKNNISLKLLKGKKVLDSGCGSGRYTCALGLLGASNAIGIDCSDMGVEKAKKLAVEKEVKNVSFIKGSVLDMPFNNEEFDFIFNNGVFHHTGNIETATRELYRVLKKDGYSWYFIYGDGGFYWYARRKMNKFMRSHIPQLYAMNVLQMIGMPMNRFIFCDNWYVPVEEHTSVEQVEELFKKIGFSEFRRCCEGRITDFDNLVVNGSDKDRQMWGEGELRYLLKK